MGIASCDSIMSKSVYFPREVKPFRNKQFSEENCFFPINTWASIEFKRFTLVHTEYSFEMMLLNALHSECRFKCHTHNRIAGSFCSELFNTTLLLGKCACIAMEMNNLVIFLEEIDANGKCAQNV